MLRHCTIFILVLLSCLTSRAQGTDSTITRLYRSSMEAMQTLTTSEMTAVRIEIAQNESNTYLELLRRMHPQEKFHVMTNGEFFEPGDTIWMRIWVQDGTTLRDSQIGSEFVYVDITNNLDNRMALVKVKRRQGRFCGYIVLPRYLTGGHYTLSAYTHYCYDMPQQYFFKKEIHVLDRERRQLGYNAMQLHYHRQPDAPMLRADANGKRSANGGPQPMPTYTLQLPANTWYSISVTDDQLMPIDTTTRLTAMLPRVPDYFTADGPTSDKVIAASTNPETRSVVAGVLNTGLYPDARPPKEVSILNLATNQFLFTKLHNKDFFYCDSIDVPENSMIVVNVKNQFDDYYSFYVTPRATALPLKISHIRHLHQDRYFYKPRNLRPQDYVAYSAENDSIDLAIMRYVDSLFVDSVRMLDNVDVTAKVKKRRDRLTKAFARILASDYVDPYAQHAKKTVTWEEFLDNWSVDNVRDIVDKYFTHRLHIQSDSMLYYHPKEGPKVPVRMVLNDREWPIRPKSDGTHYPCDLLRMSVVAVSALDFIPADEAQQFSPDPEHPNSPIVRIQTISAKDILRDYGNFSKYCFIAFGYQDYKAFDYHRYRTDLYHTRYWNPALYSGLSGRVTLQLPLPADHHTTYTLRAEGITPDGELVSVMRRIAL